MATTAKTTQDISAKLLETLSEIDRPGDVCTSDDRPLTMPGLEVESVGVVSLPLGETQAEQLIDCCRQAPYGKGTETVVDTDVRRVWELDPEQFQLTNPKWEPFVAEIVSEVQQKLGLEDRKLDAHLYKLLVYEKGSFFLPHRDGEKLDRMVATLVIGLPSVCEGGELIVSHDGRQQEIAMAGAASGHELSYAAFYADCQHEVRPLRSGYRLCLTYNVTLTQSRSKRGVVAPSYGADATAIAELLTDWRASTNTTGADARRLAITLEHRYTQEGLSVDKLKGIDRARAEVLFESAEQADCVAHLALVTLWQTGSAEGGYDEYSHGYGRRGHWDDDEDEGDDTGSEYEMGEIYESGLSVDHWSDREGNKVSLGEIRLSEDEIVANEPIDEGDPSREDFEGFTGNAGMTLERWYHRAAIVIWPREQHFSVLCSAGTDASIGGLQPLVQKLLRASKSNREEQLGDCLSFANAIIDSWQPGPINSWERNDEADRDAFPRLLCELDEPGLMRRFLSQIMTRDGEVQLDRSFMKFCKQHGWTDFETELTSVIAASQAGTVVRNAELLRTICSVRDKNTERIILCTRLSQHAVEALKAFDQQPSNDNWRIREVNRAALLVSLAEAMLAVDVEKPLLRLVEHALACDKYDLTDAHLAAIFTIEKRLAKLTASSPAISHWLAACRSELESRTAQAPKKPTDYRRSSSLSCDCGDCVALSLFLANPDERQARFPLAKHRRQHLHRIIDDDHCDCTHVTQRTGRPYTLVCTKTTASYDATCKIYERDLDNLSRVIALEKKLREAVAVPEQTDVEVCHRHSLRRRLSNAFQPANEFFQSDRLFFIRWTSGLLIKLTNRISNQDIASGHAAFPKQIAKGDCCVGKFVLRQKPA